MSEIDRMRDLADALTHVPDELADVDLVPCVRDAVTRPFERPRRPAWWPMVAAGVPAAAVAAIVAVQWAAPGPAVDGVRRKAGAPGGDERWVAVHAYRVRGGAATPADGRIGAGDAMAFAYTNLGPRPFAHAMVFGVDGGGRVRWYHPAYEGAGDDPPAIAIESGVERAELPEAIRHDLAPGPLRLHALFCRAPVRVSAVEAAVRDGGVAALPGCVARTERIEVTP